MVECKSRRRISAFLRDAVEQARRHAGEGQLGIAVLHEANKPSATDLVVMRWSDFLEWFADVEPGP